MILVEGIRCDVFQCLSYRWKRRKDIERMAKKNTYDAGSIAILEGLEAVRKKTRNVYRKCFNQRSEPSDL